MDRAEILKQVLEQNPNDAFARYGLAMEYSRAGEIEAALAEFKKLLELHPNYIAGYQMAGQMLSAAGRNEEARQMLEAGIATAGRAGNKHAQEEMQGLLAELR
ncbi:MAG TPA: tetratricopeptide repeat protein [Terriglobales bacterium]|jgi:tetratricopeptide (TPR) repeat protein|nr:tetratricopeptide repeat protein [Terriglobales bacterium]